MKEIIVREGFLPRQPWQAKRRTIGRVPGQQGTEKKVLCDPLRGIFASCAYVRDLRSFRCCLTCYLGKKDSRKYLLTFYRRWIINIC